MYSRIWGIDIGSTGIKAVEVTPTWRGRRVTNYGFFPFVSKGKEDLRREKLARLREVLPKLERGGEGVILPIPSHRTMVHRIPLPFRDRKKNEKIVKYEVEPLLPFPIDQVVVDFYGPGKDQKEKEALVFAVRKEDLAEQISLMKDAGVDPEAVVPEALALFWLAKTLGMTSGQAGSLLDLGHEKATLIIWCDDTLTLVRSIPLAGGSLGRALEAGPQLSHHPAGDRLQKKAGALEGEGIIAPVLDRLAEEVKRTLVSYEYAPQGRPVENIFLTGGAALLPGLENRLGGRLQKTVKGLDLEEYASSLLQEVPEENHPALAVALGAALGGASSERVNFRKEEFSSSRKAQKARTRWRVLGAYALILAVLGIGSFSLNFYLQEKRYQNLKGEIRKEFLQAMPEVKKVVNEVQQLKSRVREEKARLDSLGGPSGSGASLEIIRELSLLIEPAWKIRVTELVIEPETVDVTGEAGSFDAVNQLKAKLDRSSQFKEVQLKTARASGLDNVIEFKLQMKRGI